MRCDSAAIVAKTSELLPEPETPVNAVSRRFGISTLTSLRLFSRAPCTRIISWLSAMCCADDFVAMLVKTPSRNGCDGSCGYDTSWMRIWLPAGSRKAQSRAPYG